MPESARMTSNRPGNFPSRSLIRNRARQPASSKSITRFLAACVTQDAVGWVMAPRILILRLACSITASTCRRAPDRVIVSKKSQASRASAWERTKAAHVVELRSGAGSIPASGRISQTAETATFTPSSSSSPRPRRSPPPGFSRTSRNTRTRIERTVRGRPGRRGRDRWACRRATRSRCQRSTVSGRTTKCSPSSTSLGSRCSSAANNARSPGVNRALSGPSCAARPRVGGAARGSPRLCPRFSSVAAAAARVRASEVAHHFCSGSKGWAAHGRKKTGRSWVDHQRG